MPSPPNTSGLVQREPELAALESTLSGARAGEGSIAIVDGHAGVGKSSVLAAARRAAGATMQGLSATGREPEREFAFGVALQLFEEPVARAGEAERARLLDGPARLAAPLFDVPAGERLPETGFTLLHGLYWLTANVAQRRPLVLFVDDGHLADEATQRFLLYLAHRVGEHPVAVVVAAELDAPLAAPSPHLAELAAHPATTVLRVEPLSAESAALVLRGTTHPGADDAFSAACHQATAGNPRLLGLLGADLGVRGLEPTAGSVAEIGRAAPLAVAETVRARLRRAEPGALALASAVATFGADVELRHAASLAALEPPDAARVAGELVAAGVLRGGTRLSFAQPIVALALDEARGPAERAEAHAGAARVLREEGAPEERVAGHLLRASRSGSPWVVDVLAAAGNRALERGAPVVACTYLRRALAEPPPAGVRSALIATLGRAEGLAATPGALELLREGAEQLPDRRERAELALSIGRILTAQGRHRTAASTFLDALAVVADDAGGPRADLWVSYATAARIGMAPNGSEAPPAWASAPAWVADHDADGPAGRLLLAHRAFELALEGRPRAEVRDLAVRALGAGRLVGEQGCDGVGAYLAAVALGLAEELKSAAAVLAGVVEDARARGSRPGFAQASAVRAWALLRLGNLPEARQEVRRALSPDGSVRLPPSPAHAVQALLEIESGDLEPAAVLVERWERSADPTTGLDYVVRLALRARLRLGQGRAEEALADFTDCGVRTAGMGVTNPAVVGWRSGAALALAQLGRLAEARRAVEEELALARGFGAPGAISRSLRVLAQLETGTAALERLRESVEVLEGSQAELERARALVDLGAALRRAGKRAEARDPLRGGLDLAEHCGADAIIARALAELTASGGRPRRAALTGAAALTPRERQVATEAARGLSNREIADVLVITVKTVEWHLRHAYRKLEVRSRRELMAALPAAPDHD